MRYKEYDIPTEYLRSAHFDYQHFIDSKDLKVVYIADKEELDKNKRYIVKDFYSYLQSVAK